jgi:hypothetical protein
MTKTVLRPPRSPFLIKKLTERSGASIEAEYDQSRHSSGAVTAFLGSVDESNFEQGLLQLTWLAERVVDHAKTNLLNLDLMLAETHEREGYVGGLRALQQWALRQPWVGERERAMHGTITHGLAFFEKHRSTCFEVEETGNPSLGAVAHVLVAHRLAVVAGNGTPEIEARIAWLKSELETALGGGPYPKTTERWIEARDWARSQIHFEEETDADREEIAQHEAEMKAIFEAAAKDD